MVTTIFSLHTLEREVAVASYHPGKVCTKTNNFRCGKYFPFPTKTIVDIVIIITEECVCLYLASSNNITL